MMMKSINPYTNEIVAEYEIYSSEKTNSIIDLVFSGWLEYKKSNLIDRANKLLKVAEILRQKTEALSQLMTIEMGKPILQSKAEIEKCAWVCEYYAQNTESELQDVLIASDASKSYVSYRPLGVVLAIMPWNFPFWQVFRFAAPTLSVGNAVVLKHSPNVCGCALEIEKIFIEAGFDNNIFRVILTPETEVDSILANPKIAAVTLTGSTRAGRSVSSIAGKYLKKSVLELGGSDPYIILDDADLDIAIPACTIAKLINTGQSCIASKRFIVTPKIYNEFLVRFTESLSKLQFGDPFDISNQLGTIARKDLRDTLHLQVTESVIAGANILTGGFIPDLTGLFYPPTILTNIKPKMPAYTQELFGPVASIIEASDENDAIRIANDTTYGLGAAIFSQNIEKAELIAKNRIEAGACFVNSFVKSDPRLPFGGIKESGYGRELSLYGLREFANIKTIYVK